MARPSVSARPSKATKVPRPPTPTEKALATVSTTVARARRRISAQDRRFVTLYVERGCKDAYQCMVDAGFKRVAAPLKLVARLADVIEGERLVAVLNSQMELDEALIGTAEIARDKAVDGKIRLAAYRTVLEVHGALGNRPLPPASRSELAKQVAEIIDRVGRRVGTSPGSQARVRALISATGDAAAVEVEESGPHPSSPLATVSLPPDQQL